MEELDVGALTQQQLSAPNTCISCQIAQLAAGPFKESSGNHQNSLGVCSTCLIGIERPLPRSPLQSALRLLEALPLRPWTDKADGTVNQDLLRN